MINLKGIRVLLVEDEPLIALDHACHLADAGAEVVGPFPASKQALVELEHAAVDVAVIDYVLCDQTSADLQQELTRRKVPFVVVTAYPKVLVRREESQQVLSKPVDSETLCSTVSRIRGPK
ncbi:MAG: response regulator [Hyphomicrobium sp.]|jgi:two-component SAPR family response regulator